jgi:Domain of unknown function (DUF1772)
MTILSIRFCNILFAGLMAGALLIIWIGFNPQNLSAQTYVEQQQGLIKALNTLMPLVGLLTIILTVVAAFMQMQQQNIFGALLVAAGLLILTGLITKFGNQPINSIVLTWSKTDIPTNWIELRDKWWSLHIVRTLVVCIAFLIIVWANMKKD